jgi:hypothetical protein
LIRERVFIAGMALVIAADECHAALSPLFDASVRMDDVPSAGGGTLLQGLGKLVTATEILPR